MQRVPGDLDHLRRLVGGLLGLDVVDVGCGAGGFARRLAADGAQVTGVEVSEALVARARVADTGAPGPVPGFAVGRGEALPLPDGSQDLVVYLRSLHHVPVAAMGAALQEARRVLRRDGRLYVVEPVPAGEFHALLELVEDEREVRAAARRALTGADRLGFAAETGEDYETIAAFGSLEEVRARIVGVDAARGPAFDAHRAELERRYRAVVEGEGGVRVMRQPHRVEVLRAV